MTWRVYFFTFGAYARWLHGSSKGSYSHNKGRMGSNPGLEAAMASSLTSEPYEFTLSQRVWLHDAIYRYCIKNGLIVDALNVRLSHIHIVISTQRNLTREEIIHDLKGAIARLLHEEGILPIEQRVWERRYTCSRLTYYKSWYNRVHYTLFGQGSNYYLRGTRFARYYKIPFIDGEPDAKALRDASASAKVNAIRYNTLKHGDVIDPIEEFDDDYDVEA